MHWWTRLNEPFFHSQSDAEEYVNRELTGAVPEGWTVRRSPDQHLTWIIGKQKLEPGDWVDKDYALRVVAGLDVLIFTYENNDAGCNPLLHQLLQKALVIDAVMLRGVTLGECLRFLFANHKPNEWGYE